MFKFCPSASDLELPCQWLEPLKRRITRSLERGYVRAGGNGSCSDWHTPTALATRKYVFLMAVEHSPAPLVSPCLTSQLECRAETGE